MESNPVKAVELKNSLKLEIHDISKKMPGDRWLVSLLARIRIPVNPESGLFKGSEYSKEEIEHLLGKEVVFEQKRERFFIDGKHRDSVFEELCDSFLNSSLRYISLPDFPEKFVIKQFKDRVKRAFIAKAAGQFRSE
jgi:hypothetical protein